MTTIGKVTQSPAAVPQKPLTEAEIVAKRVGQVYVACAAAFAVTLVSAVSFSALGFSVTLIKVALSAPLLTAIGLTAIGISLLFAVLRTPKEQTSLKHGLFGAFAVWHGLALSPLVLINAPAFVGSAGAATALVGGLGMMAMSLKESFEKYETILFVALSALACLSLGALVLPAGGAALAHELSYVGGFSLFSAYIMVDTHKARSAALKEDFDPINHATNIYLDVLNLMVRLWEMFARIRKK